MPQPERRCDVERDLALDLHDVPLAGNRMRGEARLAEKMRVHVVTNNFASVRPEDGSSVFDP
jgi:hypothetical protein